jgi:hypothetical protein
MAYFTEEQVMKVATVFLADLTIEEANRELAFLSSLDDELDEDIILLMSIDEYR